MRRISKKSKWMLIGALIYVAVPQDLIPEYIFGIGIIDDAAVLGLLYRSMLNDLKKNQ